MTIYRIVRRLTENDLVKWVAEQDPEKSLDSDGISAIAQFLRDMGCVFERWTGSEIYDGKRYWGVPDWIIDADIITNRSGAINFGQLNRALRKHYAEKEVPLDI